ncbi:MAG: penicillin-binding protein 2 [Erysipelothrix sp.]|nr:penicillin-binding protein 2 [Erysipelothrix sp.]
MSLFKRRNYKGSSDHLQKDLNLFKTMNKRMVILMVAVALVATSLIGRLYYIQIINAEHYKDLVAMKETIPITNGTARGEIYDRNGELVVTNKPINTINYLSRRAMNMYDQYDLALKFAERYEVEFELMDRELKDLYIFLNENGKDLVTSEELKELLFNDAKVNQLKLSRVTPEHIATITDIQKEAFKVYLKMNTQTQGNAAIILENASDADISFLSENLNDFPGFSWGTTWERQYVGIEGLQGIVGSVNDIPYEKLSYMRAKGYSNNDKIGVSGLEYTYEEYLSGVKTQYKIDPVTGENVTLVKGEKGHDLILTIDMQLQEKLFEEVKREWLSMKGQPAREYMHGIDFVSSNPQTGEILAIVGLRESSDGVIYNDPSAVLLEAHPVGSVVKGATVYTGLQEGVMKPGEIVQDRPLHIAGTQPRVSWTTLGPVNDLTALQKSSNIYMFMVAIKLGGGTYIPNAPLNFNKPIEDTFSLMRNYFGQFGLGVETMIDFPREETGYKGASQSGGLLLEFSVGQYDNYNAMQLNQYISTIANGGYRLKPYFVKEVRSSTQNVTILKNDPLILNEIEGKESLDRVREGLRLCNYTGACGPYRNKPYTSAGKTGTAEYSAYGNNMINNSFVFFAPFEDPIFATSCIHSGAYYGRFYENVCKRLTPKFADIYMNSR